MRVPAGAPILTAAAMRAAEEAVFATGTPQAELMERAGMAVAREAARFAGNRPILVLAGPGNNGGDAYVAARHLRDSGHDVQVAALGEPKAGAAVEMKRLWTGDIVALDQAQPRPVLVDGLFGTGMARSLDPAVAGAFQRLVDAAHFSLAIDLPSGLATDTGEALGAPYGITATLALGSLKPGHVLGDGLTRCGHVLLADIDIPIASNWRTVARPHLSAPATASHKYSRGMVVVIEGAMQGAARLSAAAALSGGAGYVLLAGRDPTGGPDALVRRAASDPCDLFDDARIGAVVVGPGLGRDRRAGQWLTAALASPHPLVLDGDALTLLGGQVARLRERRAPTFLTPHAGEFERMFGTAAGSKIDRTRVAAGDTGATILHKGGDTVIASPDGCVRVLAGASSWLSTAGTGDILAGVLGARVAGGGEGLEAAETAAWLHGRAAQLAGPAFTADALTGHLAGAIGECL